MLFLASIFFIVSFLSTFVAVPVIIRYCTKRKIGGNDVNKEGRPFVPGLGGLAVVFALLVSFAFLYAISLSQDLQNVFNISLGEGVSSLAIAAILVVGLSASIGLVDDFFSLPHKIKLLLPILISFPIIFLKMSELAVLSVPILGALSFIPPIVYLLVLIPIGTMAVTNVTNTFAGFNGLEAGLSSLVVFFLLLIGLVQGNYIVVLLSVPFIAALLAFLFYNWYPARIFIDDVGTLTIGAMLSAITILGSLEFVGAVLLLPYIIDFLFFKIPNKLPSTKWWPDIKVDRLYFSGKPVHFGQWVVKIVGGKKGITEQNLVLFFIVFEIVLGALSLLIIGLI